MFTMNIITRNRNIFYNFSKRNVSNGSFKYCLDSVRQHDYENFLSTLLLDKNVVASAVVIRAFNVEIARIQDQISDKNIGLMRFQFWNDTVDKIISSKSIDSVPAHPIAQELYKIYSKNAVSKHHLNRLINSRKKNLGHKYFVDLEEMEKYAEESVSPVYYAILESAKIKNVDADHAASHLGKAQGIANMLRSVGLLSQYKMVPLPQDILMKYNVSHEDVLRFSNDQKLKDVVFDVASRADQHLKKARNIKVPKVAKKIFLPAVAVDSYLKRLQKNDFLLFDKRLGMRDSLLPIKLYWYKILRKY